ncbi:MAG TPA: TIGR02996 domain-containing protein, partial [Kofleriaceae bacterium]|nr:TIGR02996 domain-containing protein [Kofleriaceae bacterium]
MTTRAELEEAILADPDAREAYAVYADWLLERGEPDGELVAIQLALEDAPGDAALQARERELVAAREQELRRLFYYAVWQEICDPVWRRGVLHAIAVRGGAYTDDNACAYRELVADPIARFLRELTVRPATVIHGEPTPGDAALVEAIAEVGAPRALRRLVFDPQEFQVSWTRLTDLSPIYRHLTRLEELVIEAGDVTLGRIDLPALRSLEIVTGGLRAHVLESIAAASWPRLERLVIYLGTERYGGECTLATLSALLDGEGLPAGVRTLGLCNCEFGDELVPALARSRILPRL